MKCFKILLICQLIFITAFSQEYKSGTIITDNDLAFLEKMTKDVLDSSRIYPGQFISNDFGSNNINLNINTKKYGCTSG